MDQNVIVGRGTILKKANCEIKRSTEFTSKDKLVFSSWSSIFVLQFYTSCESVERELKLKMVD